MASSINTGVGLWRTHTYLDESDGAESSPEAPDRFRKLRSSSSLNSLRMSLRKRLPLRSVQTNSLPENPTWESLQAQQKTSTARQLARSARNSIGGIYQKLQRNKAAVAEECLVATPGCISEGDENLVKTSSRTLKHTPGTNGTTESATPRRTPRSAAASKRTPASRRTPKAAVAPDAEVRGVKPAQGRRQLVRMAALRSPFASPNTQNQKRAFDRDLESVSSGLRKLKRLSHVFNDVIGRDERSHAAERYGGVMMRRMDPRGKLSCSSMKRRTQRLSNAVGGWAQTAVDCICKPN